MRFASRRAFLAHFFAVTSLGVLYACGGHGHSGVLPYADRHARLQSIDYASVVLSDGPTAYYHLSDTGASAADSSGNALNGAVGASISKGAPSLLPSTPDSAMTLPGTASQSGIVSVPATPLLQPANAFSLEAWIRFSTIPVTYTIVTGYGSDSFYAPYDLFFRAGGTLVAQVYTSAGVLEVAAPAKLSVNTTYHIVSTYDGTTEKLYVNGSTVATGTKTGTISNYVPGAGFAIGDDAALSDPAFAGTIDEVAVYAGKVLTAAQVLNHFNAGTGGSVVTPTPSPTPAPTPTPPPVASGQYASVVLSDAPTAYYRLSDTGLTAADATGHGLGGTVGSSVAKGVPGLVPTDTDTAMTFPGNAVTAGVISFPQSAVLQPSTAVSLEGWIRFATTPATYSVAFGYGSDSFYAPYELFFRSNGQLVAQFYLAGGVLEVPSPSGLQPNTTYYIASTYDGTTGRLYVNGAPVASGSRTGTFANYVPGFGFAIGADAALSDPAFKGTIDDVAIYSGKTLTAAQILNHYKAGTAIVATPTPSPAPTPGVDWTTMAFDIQRTGYNPNETVLNKTNVGGLHPYWPSGVSLAGGQIGEPVLATSVNTGGQFRNILYAASGSGFVDALDADSGAVIWTRQLGSVTYMCGTSTFTFGSNGAPAIARAQNRIYVPDGQAQVHALDLATGAEAPGWPVTIATQPDHNFIYGALTYNPSNRLLYAETSSTCDISPWTGRITAINTASAGIVGNFYPTQGTSGGGIWGFGGASVDPATNDVYIATGNADGANQSAFYAEQIVALSADLSTVLGNSYASLPPNPDADYGATPLLFQPPGCPPLLAAMNKAGVFVLYNRSNVSAGPLQTIAMSISSDAGDFVGVPAYYPVTNEVYVEMPATFGIYMPGAAAFAVQPDCTLNPTPVWNAAFGADGATTSSDTLRSPISIANGVVYLSDYQNATTYALDATSGAILWSSALSGKGVVGPVVANGHLYTSDVTGHISAWQP